MMMMIRLGCHYLWFYFSLINHTDYLWEHTTLQTVSNANRQCLFFSIFPPSHSVPLLPALFSLLPNPFPLPTPLLISSSLLHSPPSFSTHPFPSTSSTFFQYPSLSSSLLHLSLSLLFSSCLLPPLLFSISHPPIRPSQPVYLDPVTPPSRGGAAQH